MTADVLPQTPVANTLPASPVRLRTLVPAFPAGLTPIVPVALVTVTPATTNAAAAVFLPASAVQDGIATAVVAAAEDV